MTTSKKFLQIAIGISLIVCSFSLFMLTMNRANANPLPKPDIAEFKPVGTLQFGNDVVVVGFNSATNEIKGLSILNYQYVVKTAKENSK